MRAKSGLSVWEIVLFTIFLSVAGSASLFFFFVNSSDVRKAQQKYEWVYDINEMLDEVCSEISNSIYIDTPFVGESKDCFYYSPVDPSKLEVGKDLEGFVFDKGQFNYVMKDGRPTTRRFGRFHNPLVPFCKDGKFVRISASQLELSFKAQKLNANNNESEIKEFKRIINLRNQ
jgi:hypothetical protein